MSAGRMSKCIGTCYAGDYAACNCKHCRSPQECSCAVPLGSCGAEGLVVASTGAVADSPRAVALARLAATAEAFPDLRIGQIIVNALPDRFGNDPYNITDEDLAAALDDYTRDWSGR